MKTNRIKDSLNNSFDKVTPDCFCSIISKIESKEGAIIEMDGKQEKKEFKMPYLKYAMAAVVVLLVGLFGINYYNANKVLATINFDVNPSVAVTINNKRKVTKVDAKNEDGKKIINSMDLEGASLEVATNALIGSMLRLGYIDELKNSILLSVDGNSEQKSDEILIELQNEVDTLISSYNVDGSIITQTVDNNKELENLAVKYGISVGKVQLINEMLEKNKLYTFDELAKLTINELNLLATSKKNNVTTVNISGSASDKSYIGRDKATSIALVAANVNKSNVKNLEVELDLENKVMVYEVEFNYNNKEYDYEINATTGKIIKGGVESDHDYDSNDDNNDDDDKNPNTGSYISKARAKEIALKHAGVTTARDFDIEFEYKAGVGIYEVDFEVGNKEYDYEINATTGKIIKSKTTVDNDVDDQDDDHDDDRDDD